MPPLDSTTPCDALFGIVFVRHKGRVILCDFSVYMYTQEAKKKHPASSRLVSPFYRPFFAGLVGLVVLSFPSSEGRLQGKDLNVWKEKARQQLVAANSERRRRSSGSGSGARDSGSGGGGCEIYLHKSSLCVLAAAVVVVVVEGQV